MSIVAGRGQKEASIPWSQSYKWLRFPPLTLCSGPTSGSLQEQYMTFTAESSLQAPGNFLTLNCQYSTYLISLFQLLSGLAHGSLTSTRSLEPKAEKVDIPEKGR